MEVIKEKYPRSAREGLARKHHCLEHDLVCRPTMIIPGRRMIYNCPEGCSLDKRETDLRSDILPQTLRTKRKKNRG
jgi:hypothetical protein